jgi:hypothetical protein
MWLAGWVVRVVLLITAPVYFLCRLIAATMSRLDEWSWRAIHEEEPKKPPQSEAAQPEETAKRVLR